MTPADQNMNAEEVEGEFASRAILSPGGLLLFDSDVALELVERARIERVAVLGVNCLLLSAEGTQEPIAEMSDYSVTAGRGDGSWDAAAAHINARRDTSLKFEVVLGRAVDPPA